MSSSDAQPPLSRREARERERAAAAGGQPVTPPPTVAAPTTGEADGPRRPGSHVAPSPSGPAQSAVRPGSESGPRSAGTAPSAGVFPLTPAPASATEIVPGTGGLTRRQLRLMREAEGQAVQPVPLRAPTPHSSDRTVQDVIGSVDDLHGGAHDDPAQESSAEPEQLDAATVAQATEADGSPDAVEPLSEAAAHAEEPRRHRSTWAPPEDDDAQDHDAQDHDAQDHDAQDHDAQDHDGQDDDAQDAGTGSVAAMPTTAVPSSSTPVVFPLSLDDDTNEVPVQRPTPATDDRNGRDVPEAPRLPAAFQRPTEPKPVTTAFEPPAGHWSQQAQDGDDVHDATGVRRLAVQDTNSIVLPDSALADPTGALNATGEVILTGSIDLPASLSSTGSHRPIDGAEVDRLLEQHDEQPETDASPVRASRAVSSHTSTRQVVLAAAKPKESRTPVILGVTVGAVGLAAAGVIIVALLTTHFGG
ncbi:hypothetical protein QUG92_03020 [Curtobacterium sp. RHCKG23]|uniref:Uncharacterized protein n=1 Tax=Curtobacterium citri TaxID=3055139 RepID=A0ABT7T3A5_9MICO|nr:hypothetical protein [Curtobacterium citri]MDM7884066.1 hypothetical protein [Curtobacterium citri]